MNLLSILTALFRITCLPVEVIWVLLSEFTYLRQNISSVFPSTKGNFSPIENISILLVEINVMKKNSNKMKIYSNIYSKSDKKIHRKYCCRNQPKNRKNRNCFHRLITNFIDWHNFWNVSKAHDNWTRTNDVWFVLQNHPDGTAIDFIFVENIHHSDCLYALRANMFNDIFRCESSQLENPMS